MASTIGFFACRGSSRVLGWVPFGSLTGVGFDDGPARRRSRGASLGPRALQRPGDAAVLADAPEVDRHQRRRDEREADAVEHVEAEQRRLADEAAGEEGEAHVVSRVDEIDTAELQ